MHEHGIFSGRTELQRAHQGWEAAVREGIENESNCGWRKWLVENQERKLRSLRFEDLRGISKEGERIR